MKTSFHANAKTLRARALRFFTAFLTLALVLVAGCKSKRPEPSSAGAQVETYKLISIDGQPVPCTIHHGQAKLNVKAGVFRFRPDGQCESSIEFLAPDGQTFRKDVSGTFARNGDKVTFQWKRAGRTEGTSAGDKFTMNNEGMAFSYTRER